MSLKGKTAIITGSNSGIGLGVARELARSGADVVLNSFTDRPEDHPVVFVSWEGATAFCDWLGKKEGKSAIKPREAM